MPETSAYFETRYSFDPARAAVWQKIVDYLQPDIPEGGSIVDLGAGYCGFINSVKAAERHAVDAEAESLKHAAPGVVTHQLKVTNLSGLPDNKFDTAFLSNVLEHLDYAESFQAVDEIRRVLKPGGKLILMGPNFRLCYRDYFDDFTHRTIWNDTGLCDFFESRGFKVSRCEPRFMPMSFKSRLPSAAWMVPLYLALPWRPFAGQMLVIAAKR